MVPPVARIRIGMRWWLAATFVLIAALTAVLVATVSSRQADRAVRSNSEAVAVGKTVSAGFAVERAIVRGDLGTALPAAATRRNLALFVFRRDGRLLSPRQSYGIRWDAVPGGRTALAAALAERRFVQTSGGADATLAALPLRRTRIAAALVSFAPRPTAYGRSLAIFRREVGRAALWSIIAAAAIGALAAGLVARRLRRIGRAAAAIEQGRFDVPLRPGFGDEVGALALSIDRMRRQLRVSFQQVSGERDRLARLLAQLQEGVIAVDATGTIQFANARAASWLGRLSVAPGSTLPRKWGEVPLLALARGLFRADAVLAEARAVTEDGRAVSVAGVPAAGSELAVLVLVDITEQERRERSEREFVANASHELRTPVSAIVSAVEALQTGAKDVPEAREHFIDLIGRQATRLGRLTHSLLLLARAQSEEEPLRTEPVALEPLFAEVAASSERLDRLTLDCSPGLVAFGQRDVVEQILANLVGNALEHSGRQPVRLSARHEGTATVLEVSDDGPGIPAAVQERIFERFYSGRNGRRGGFGLGLAIVRDAVRMLGGTIEIDSQPARGTRVRVALPAEPGS
jgi:signal transduction histidine kinase/HAMP domain-containing protein